MEPNKRYPFNVRSFFTPEGSRQIGGGIELWRGFFQSIRPGPGRLFLNLDIATCMMYRPGALIDLCLDFFGRMDLTRNQQFTQFLSPNGMGERDRLRLQKFLTNLRVTVPATTKDKKRPIRRISDRGASNITFEYQGRNITVAQYFQMIGTPIRFPQMFCVEVRALRCCTSDLSSALLLTFDVRRSEQAVPSCPSNSVKSHKGKSCANSSRATKRRTWSRSQRRSLSNDSGAFKMERSCCNMGNRATFAILV